MTRIKMAIVVLFAPLWAVTINSAQVWAQKPVDNIDQILELSGLKKQVERIPAQMRSGFIEQQQRAKKKLSPEDYDRLLKIIMESYNASDLKQSIADYLKDRYHHGHVLAE